MPNVAAVPTYVGQDFSDAAPGHRFNLYFPIWRNDWTVDKSGKTQAIRAIVPIPTAAQDTQNVQKLLKALRDRQQQILATHPHSFSLPAKSTAPFATGLGNEHPVENGFAFLTPYGLPYLAGSGVKGVLRRAAEELALFGLPLPAGQIRRERIWSGEARPKGSGQDCPETEGRGEGDSNLTMLDVWWLFGFEGAAGAWWPLSRKEERELSQEQRTARADWKARFDDHLATLANRPDWLEFIERVLPKGLAKARYLSDPGLFVNALDRLRQEIHLRGALDVWDIFPDPKGGKLAVEIMTPHYSDYYQGKSTPHDAGQPNPIPFLALPAGSSFDFHVVCQPGRLSEHLRENWKDHLQAIFEHAFDWLGFGAKTAVGYGAMTRDEDAARKYSEQREARRRSAEQEAVKKAEAERLALLPPLEREINDVLQAKKDPNLKDYVVLLNALKANRWHGEDARFVAQRIRQTMQAEKIWKEETEKRDPGKDKDYQRTLEVKKFLG